MQQITALKSKLSRANPWLPETVKVVNCQRETVDASTITIEIPDGLKMGKAGQFNMLSVFGIGEIPISISGIDIEKRQLRHSIRGVGAVSKALMHVSIGDWIGLRGPFGKQWPLQKISRKKNVVIIAGGIGLAPVLPIIDKIEKNELKSLQTNLLVGIRSPNLRLFPQYLDQLQNINLLESVDIYQEGWKGHVGVVTQLIKNIENLSPNTLAFICGPEVMMRYCAQELLLHGLKQENIFISMERHMKCAIGFCGRCQLMEHFLCKTGPIFSYAQMTEYLNIPYI
ncbi:MAG: FAD/NAD(P)-binding protein [Oligoflexales bacterium]|nr:FAD/NAD(P)-binding protein [Oligoflexales bacterium]